MEEDWLGCVMPGALRLVQLAQKSETRVQKKRVKKTGCRIAGLGNLAWCKAFLLAKKRPSSQRSALREPLLETWTVDTQSVTHL